jgi:hypothetical protein
VPVWRRGIAPGRVRVGFVVAEHGGHPQPRGGGTPPVRSWRMRAAAASQASGA